jgi:hypothetical protein
MLVKRTEEGKGGKQKTRLIKGRGRGRTSLSSSDIQLLASLLSPPSSSVIGVGSAEDDFVGSLFNLLTTCM